MLTNDNALVWTLTIHSFDGKVADKSLTREINNSYEADESAGNYTRRIVPPLMLAKTNAAKSKMRDEFNAATHPHHGKGSRTGAKKRYLDVKAIIEQHSAILDHEADHFMIQYSDWIIRGGPEQYLKKMYKPNLYPEASQIRQRFFAEYSVLPYTVPPTGDSSLDLTLVQEFEKAQLKEDQLVRTDISNRIHDIVSKIYQRLISDGKFRKDPFENLSEKAELIKTLNIFDDPRIDSIAIDAARLANTDLSAIRKDDSQRSTSANQANDLLAKLEKLRNTPHVERRPDTRPEDQQSQDIVKPKPRLVLNDSVPTEIQTNISRSNVRN